MMKCPICGQKAPAQQERCDACGGWLDPSKGDPLIGREVGHFQLESLIGRGGMGAIYKARHKVLGTEYAIKLLHPQLASDPTTLERFRREAIAASQLKHDNVVFIADFGWTEGIGAYIVMEYLEGISLGDALRTGRRFTAAELSALFRQVCSALYAAHKRNIIHRDLKPDNIFLAPLDDGGERVKLLDFGIARIVEEGTFHPVTYSQSAIGTPQYMAPEQAQGRWGEIDERTDIYSLGVILYKLLTGTTPIRKGTIQEIIHLKITGALTPLAHHRPDLAQTPLEQTLHRMLALQKEARYPDAKVLMKALTQAFAALPPGPITPPKDSHLSEQQTMTTPSGPPSLSHQTSSSGDLVLLSEISQPSLPSPNFPPLAHIPISHEELLSPLSPPSAPFGNPAPPTNGFAPMLPTLDATTPANRWLPYSVIIGLLLALFTGLGWLVWQKFSTPAPASSPDQRSLPPLRAGQPASHDLSSKAFTRPLTSKAFTRPLTSRKTAHPQHKKSLFLLLVKSRPRATLQQHGKVLCKTPCKLQARKGQSIGFWLLRKGYQPKYHRWKVRGDEQLNIRLPKKHRRRKYRRRLLRKRRKRKKKGLFDDVPIP